VNQVDSDLPVMVGNGRPEVRPVGHSQVTMTQLMAPQDTNLMGNVFGGVILAAVDRIAYVCPWTGSPTYAPRVTPGDRA
jgi:acyl-CoA hydrolase